MEPLISPSLSLSLSISSQIPSGAGSCGSPGRDKRAMHSAVRWWHGSRDSLTLFCRTGADMAAGRRLRAPSPCGGTARKRARGSGSSKYPCLNRSHLTYLPSLACFLSLHCSLCTRHRNAFSTGKCIFCARFVMHVTSLVKMNISPAAFSGSQEEIMNGVFNVQPQDLSLSH